MSKGEYQTLGCSLIIIPLFSNISFIFGGFFPIIVHLGIMTGTYSRRFALFSRDFGHILTHRLMMFQTHFGSVQGMLIVYILDPCL